MSKKIEEFQPIIAPVEPEEHTTQAKMVKLLIAKINEIIVFINTLQEETIKIKKKKK